MSRLFCVTAFRTGECLFYCLTNNARRPRRGSGGERHRASPMNGQSVPAYLPPGPAKRKGLRSLNNAMGNLFLTDWANKFSPVKLPFQICLP